MRELRSRARYEGVLQIVLFNAGKYLAAGAGLLVAVAMWPVVPFGGRVALVLGGAPLVFWAISSLMVSHYVYDCFPLYDFRRIARAC